MAYANNQCLHIIDVTRWYEKAGLRRDAVGSQVIDALEAQEIKETDNEKKTSTAVARQTKSFRDPKLTIGLDLGDRSSWACVLCKVGKRCGRERRFEYFKAKN